MTQRIALIGALAAVVLGLILWTQQGEVVWLVQNLGFCG